MARWTGVKPIQGDGVMPTRIRCCDKPPHEQQLTDMAGISAYFAGESLACYADRKPELRIVCGSG